MIIDLRSDTLTKPTEAMREAMFSAAVGDDVFGEDPTVNLLEEKAMNMFGMEAAMFCPSGTMTNQIAIRVHTQPMDEVICHRMAHIYNYEGGGIMANSHASVRLIEGDRGRISPQQIEANINPDDIHFARTRLVCLENSVNKAGGSVYSIAAISEIAEVCKRNKLNLHVDGARIFNALTALGASPASLGVHIDSLSICLSKGLGAPVGSILLGPKSFIREARRVRKVMGGGMRQAGFLAAAGIYALDHHISRLKEDHHRAAIIAEALVNCAFVDYVEPVETNIIIFKLKPAYTNDQVLGLLMEKGVLAVSMGHGLLRFVTHLDFDDDMLTRLLEILRKI